MNSPSSVGRYQLIKEIGRGAMSVVFEAEDPEIGRRLAIKLLRHELAEQDEYRESFVREAKAAGRLSHPGIVTIYDVGIWDERPFIAMELLDGETLDSYLMDNGTFALEDAVSFSQQMCDALSYAHQQGVVHRDLKPENILVLDGGRRFKITDFGIAHIEHTFSDGQDDEEKIMGTPAYMSPEQITGGKLDHRTDLYSLGIILYQITKGELPFQAVNYGAMMNAVLQQNPQPLNQLTQQGLIWQSIIFRLLQKNAELRYVDGEELSQELVSLSVELQENKQGVTNIKYVSLGARWAVALSSFIFLVMIIGMAWVYSKQSALMNQLAFDYGNSMVEIIASESAESMLLDEDVTLQAITVDIANNSQIEYLSLRDNNGHIRSSSDAEEIGQLFSGSEADELEQKSGRNTVLSNNEDYDEHVFLFETPILYQDKTIGFAHLAMSQSNLNSATRSSLLAMIVWMMLIIVAVFTGIYWLANRFTRRINRSRQAIRDLRTQGQADLLSIGSHDEVARLNQEINELSQKLAGLTKTQKMTVSLTAIESLEPASLDKTVIIDLDNTPKAK